MKPGDRIQFTADIVDGPMGDRPGIIYAKQGDIGSIVGIKASGDELLVENGSKSFVVYRREVTPCLTAERNKKDDCILEKAK